MKLEIASVRAESGQKTVGYIEIDQNIAGSLLRIPIVLINGSSKGPVLFLCAGVHGDEYAGIAAINTTCQHLNPQDMKGAVVAIPVMNVPAFEAGSRTGPTDGLNLNRVFPGNSRGSITEKIASAVFTEIIPNVDCVCDLHAYAIEDDGLASANFRGNTSVAGRSFELAENFGFDVVLMNTPWVPGRLDSEASKMGVPSISPECGGEGRCQKKDVQLYEKGIRNLMIHLGILQGNQELPCKVKYVQAYIGKVKGKQFMTGIAKEGGFGTPHVTVGQEVSKGSLLYTIHNILGEIRESHKATNRGVIMSMRTFPSVHRGDVLFDIVEVIPRRVMCKRTD